MSSRSTHFVPLRQQGVALVVVLILLLIMTVLGLATLRGAMMEERMSANLYDRSLGFQSAEIALREAEDAVRASPQGGIGAALNCAFGSAQSTEPACSPTQAAAFTGGTGWTNASTAQAGGIYAGNPQYSVQYMGERTANEEFGIADDPNYGGGGTSSTAEFYRITARSNDPSTAAAASRSVTVLQSTIVRE